MLLQDPSENQPRASTGSRSGIEPVAPLVSLDRYDYYIIVADNHTNLIRDFRAVWAAAVASRRVAGLPKDALELLRSMSLPTFVFPIPGYGIYEWGGKFYRRSTDGQLPAPVVVPYKIGDCCLMSGRHVEARLIRDARNVYRHGLRRAPEISYIARRRGADIRQGPEGAPDPAWEELQLPKCDRIVAHLRDGAYIPSEHPTRIGRIARWLRG